MFRNWISSRCRTAHGVSIASHSVSRSVSSPSSTPRVQSMLWSVGGNGRDLSAQYFLSLFSHSLTHSLQAEAVRRSRHCGHEYITNELPPHTGPTLRPAPPTLPSWHRSTSRHLFPSLRSFFVSLFLPRPCLFWRSWSRNAGNLTGAAFRAAVKYFVLVPNNTGSAKK